MLGPGIHLFLQVANIADQVRALQVSLGVAGGRHSEVAVGTDIGHQIAGVGKVCLGWDIRIHIPPERQDVLHPFGLQLLQQPVHVLPASRHTGQVGHGRDVVLVLDQSGDLPCRLVHLGPSRPEGDANKVWVDVPQAVQRLVDAVYWASLFRGKHLTGENRAPLPK